MTRSALGRRPDDWDPETLEKFRDKHDLNHMEVMRILVRGGMEKLNFSTYTRWRKKPSEGGSVPRPLYREKIEEILAAADLELTAQRRRR